MSDLSIPFSLKWFPLIFGRTSFLTPFKHLNSTNDALRFIRVRLGDVLGTFSVCFRYDSSFFFLSLGKKLLEGLSLQVGDIMDVDLREGEIILKKEDDLDREIDAYFAKNQDEQEASVWPDSLVPASLADEWVWE